MNGVRGRRGFSRMRVALCGLLALAGLVLIAVGVWNLLRKPVKTYRDASLVYVVDDSVAVAPRL